MPSLIDGTWGRPGPNHATTIHNWLSVTESVTETSTILTMAKAGGGFAGGCSVRAAGVALGAVLFLGIAGCAGSQVPPPAPAPSSPVTPARSSLGPRPLVLQLDGVDPCSLLSNAQRLQFDVAQGSAEGPTVDGSSKGRTCVWSSSNTRPGDRWTGATILDHGAEHAAGKGQVRAVNRFPAVVTSPTGTDPRSSCLMLVDVAPGQALAAAYESATPDAPGMNHQVACGRAQQLATNLLATLWGQKHR